MKLLAHDFLSILLKVYVMQIISYSPGIDYHIANIVNLYF